MLVPIPASARIPSATGTLRFATSGEDAIRLAREHAPDLMLLDAELPGMSGFQVCKALKSEVAMVDFPIVFVTSHDEAAFEVAGFEIGAAAFVAKPVVARSCARASRRSCVPSGWPTSCAASPRSTSPTGASSPSRSTASAGVPAALPSRWPC